MADNKPINPLLSIHHQQVNRPTAAVPSSLEALKAKAAALQAGTPFPTPASKPAPAPAPAPAPSIPIPVPQPVIPIPTLPGVKLTAVAPIPTPVPTPKLQLPTVVQQNTPVVYAEQVEGAPKETRFKIILDNLDKAMSTQFGVDMVTIDTIRGFIKEVFQDLQREPELDALLIDRDVHNIIKFIRSVKGMAIEAQVEKKVKTKVKTDKKLAQEKLFASIKIPKLPGMPDFSDL